MLGSNIFHSNLPSPSQSVGRLAGRSVGWSVGRSVSQSVSQSVVGNKQCRTIMIYKLIYANSHEKGLNSVII